MERKCGRINFYLFLPHKNLYKYLKTSFFNLRVARVSRSLYFWLEKIRKMVKSKTKIEQQSWRKNSSELVETIRVAKKTGSKFWLQVAGILASPRRERIALNLEDIEKSTTEGDSIVIPGKVLSLGEISKKIAVIAFNFSEKAREKILKNKAQALSILEEVKRNPQAKGLRMLGK